MASNDSGARWVKHEVGTPTVIVNNNPSSPNLVISCALGLWRPGFEQESRRLGAVSYKYWIVINNSLPSDLLCAAVVFLACVRTRKDITTASSRTGPDDPDVSGQS
jgi:hypothetical protein